MNEANLIHPHNTPFADWGWVTAFFALGGTLVPGITIALQWSLAIAGIIAAICAARYHTRLIRRLDENDGPKN